MKPSLTFFGPCVFLLGAGVGHAESSPEEITFQSCRVCHGAAAGETGIPAIEGRAYDDLLASLMSLGGTTDKSTIMHRFSAGQSREELEALSRYISDLDGPNK
jgi:cytochrome c553